MNQNAGKLVPTGTKVKAFWYEIPGFILRKGGVGTSIDGNALYPLFPMKLKVCIFQIVQGNAVSRGNIPRQGSAVYQESESGLDARPEHFFSPQQGAVLRGDDSPGFQGANGM